MCIIKSLQNHVKLLGLLSLENYDYLLVAFDSYVYYRL